MYIKTDDDFIFFGYHKSGINGLGYEFCKIIVSKYTLAVYNNSGELMVFFDLDDVDYVGVEQEYLKSKFIVWPVILGAIFASYIGIIIGAILASLHTEKCKESIIKTLYGDITFAPISS